MKPKTKSELMAEWASQPGQLKKEREVKAIRKAMDDARAVMQDGLTRYVKKKTKARSMAKAEADPFAELYGWESMEQIQDAYGYGEITADRRDKLTDLWEDREAARNSRKGADKYHDFCAKKQIKSHSVRQIIEEPIQAHSVKPEETLRRIVDLLGDVPRIELFARQRVPGWDAWGDEIEEMEADT